MVSPSEQFDSFTKPRRQSPTAILLFIIKALGSVLRQAWPVFLLLWFKRSGDKWDNAFFYASIGATVISAVYSIINYFKTYFYLSETDLRYQTGLIGIEKTTIPFEKVQAIHYEQNLVHKLFNVTRLIIDTAGSAEKEFKIDALSVADAEAMKSIILEKKKSLVTYTVDVDTHDINPVVKSEPSSHVLLHLGLKDLLKAGLFHNHLQSLGWVLALVFGFYQLTADLGVKTDGILKKILFFEWQFFSILFVIFGIGVLMLLISLVRMVIRNYGFTLKRISNGFMIRRGLMKEYTFTASDTKIQAISWSDDPVKRLIKIFDLYFLQAKSMDLNSKELIRVPGANKFHIDQITDALYPQNEMDSLEFIRIDAHYFIRNRNIIYLATVLALATALVFEASFTILFITLFSMYWLTLTYLFYKKYAFKYSPGFLMIKEGQIGNKFTLAPIAHIQSIRINQSPYQRKHNLATLHFHFSSHQESIPYIPLDTAYEIANKLLFYVERHVDNK